MIVTKRLRDYFNNRLENLSEEDIKYCRWMIAIHQQPVIKISGTEVGIAEGIISIDRGLQKFFEMEPNLYIDELFLNSDSNEKNI